MIKTPASIFCLLACILFVCSSAKINAQNNTLTAKEKKDGWKLLFDGKTTNGWHTYNKNSVTKNWQVTDGALVMNPIADDKENRGDLITDDSFENYEVFYRMENFRRRQQWYYFRCKRRSSIQEHLQYRRRNAGAR